MFLLNAECLISHSAMCHGGYEQRHYISPLRSASLTNIQNKTESKKMKPKNKKDSFKNVTACVYIYICCINKKS